MGIERARVVEVYAADSASGRAGTGYQVDGRLVLTSADVVGRSGSTDVRAAGMGAWASASVAWRGRAAILEIGDPLAVMGGPAPLRWGEVVGRRPVPVIGMAFPAAGGRPQWARDPEQFVGQLSADGSVPAVGRDMIGAALFAGAELVGVVAGEAAAVPVAELAADDGLVALVGGMAVVRVETPATGFPMLR